MRELDDKQLARVNRKLPSASYGQAILWLEFGCQFQGCAAREIQVRLNGTAMEIRRALGESGAACPICRRPVTLHWVRTREEQMSVKDVESRTSVNGQMYLRDNGERAIPSAVILDDRLPPTPSGWFDAR